MSVGVLDIARSGLLHIPRMPDTREVETYFSHIEEFVETYNEYLRDMGLPFRMSGEDVLTTPPRRILEDAEIVKFLNGHDPGKTYWNQIETACRVFVEDRDTMLGGKIGSEKNISLLGPTQCGKTTTLNNVHFLQLMHFLEFGLQTAFIYLMPNKKTLENQTHQEWTQFMGLYGSLTLEYVPQGYMTIPICRSVGKGSYPNTPLSLKYFYTSILETGKSYGVYDPTAHRWRKCAALVEEVQRETKRALANGWAVRYMVDESHEAHHTKKRDEDGNPAITVVFRMMQLPELLRNDPGTAMIGASATPWPTHEVFTPVNHKLTDDYCGLNYIAGQVIDPDVNIKPPDVTTIDDLMAGLGVDTSWPLRRRAYNSYGAFTREFKHILKEMEEGGHFCAGFDKEDLYDWYRGHCDDVIVDIINKLLVEVNPKNRRGMCFRFLDNAPMQTWLQNVKDRLHPSIVVIEFFGNLDVRVRDLIAEVPQDRPYVVIPTARGRMADNFPPDCAYFWETSDSVSTATSMAQGLPGRSCGYSKNSLFIGTPKVVAKVREYIRSRGCPPLKACGGVVQGRIEDGQPVPIRRGQGVTKRVVLWANSKDPEVFRVIERFHQEVLSDPKFSKKDWKWRFKTGNARRVPQGRPDFDIWNRFFTEEFLTYLEENHRTIWPNYFQSIRLLRPGEVDEEGHQYAGDKFGMREVDKPSSRNSNYQLKSDRFVPGGEEREGSNYAVQVHVKPIYKGRNPICFEPVAINLRLAVPATTLRVVADTILPNDESGFYGLLTEDQKDTVGLLQRLNDRRKRT